MRMFVKYLRNHETTFHFPSSPFSNIILFSIRSIMSTILKTDKAPAAIGPYSQGLKLGNLVITSGQIPVDPVTGTFSDNIEVQARQSLMNVKAVVEAAGYEVRDIVKTTVFVKDMNDFGKVNAIYQKFFEEFNAPFPARSCVEVARLPKDVGVEIEAIAYRPFPVCSQTFHLIILLGNLGGRLSSFRTRIDE